MEFGPVVSHPHPRYSRPLGMLYLAIAVHQTRSGGDTPDHQRQGANRHAERAGPMTKPTGSDHHEEGNGGESLPHMDLRP
jgi:hypothetical protein